MKKFYLTTLACLSVVVIFSQNIFSYNDGIVRYDKTKSPGSAQNPNSNITGLQKWVSTPTTGITGSWDATSYKAYYINIAGQKMAFRVKYPKSFLNADSVNKKYPMMLFLCGAGEVGCPSNGGLYNNEKQLQLGGKLFNERVNNNEFDGFLIYPQLVNAAGCWGSWGSEPIGNLTILLSFIDSMVKYVRADNDRLLVTGLSGGGFGAWRMAGNFPTRVTKIMPSASVGNVNQKNAMVHIPIWFGTGGKDTDPSPAQAQQILTAMKDIGADIRYTIYPLLGHGMWNQHWAEPDFVPQMNDMHKANPLVFFGRYDFCPNEAIAGRMGLSPGFYAYEWQKDGVTIATRTNTTNVINQPAYVTSFTGNEIIVKAFGTYRVRFKRFGFSAWSDWSRKPVVIKSKATTQTPPIQIAGNKSKFLPSLDGSNTVPLTMPAGFINYQWYRSSDNVLVASTQVFNAPIGVFKGRYSEQFGCGTTFSPDFAVISAAGTPQPGAPSGLTSNPLSQTAVQLNWTNGANATGIEVYRGTTASGPYVFDTLVAASNTSYKDSSLLANTTYYYVLRAVNGTGASARSNESTARTLNDIVPPTAPGALQYRGSTQKTVLLKWNPSTDNTGVLRYDIYANGSKVFSTTGTSFTVSNLDSLTTYAFTVKAVDNYNNQSPASNQVSAYTHRQGLNFKYFTGSWSTLPNFNTLPVNKSGITDTVNINNTSIKTITTNYGFLWQGFIYIPVAASYTFETYSDDGSKLYIDVPYTNTATALVSNDGVHGGQSRTGTISLTQGYHSIAITYFQGTNGYDMQLFWSNNAGLARERIGKNFLAYVNGNVTAPPAAPSGLTATALTFNKIRLNWTDNSSNETGFEIARSTSVNGVYTSVGNAVANAVTYTDSGLTASTAYFYKIRSIRSGSESAFTTAASATTPAAPATPVAPGQLQAEAGANNSILLSWTDNSANETNFTIYRSNDGVTFGLLVTVAANSNAYTDLTTAANTRYYYYVAGINASGTGEPSNTVTVKAGNEAPVLANLTNVFVKTDATVTEDFTASDDPDDNVTVSIVNKPSFIGVTNIGGNNFRLTISPNFDNVGWHTITVVAQDNGGSSSTKQILVSVADKNTRSVYVNIGNWGKVAPAPWNNWEGVRSAGNILANLKDENNITTPFSVTTVSGWASTTVIGHITGNNSGIAPDAVLESGIWDNGPAKQLRFAGLNPAMKYNLQFVGSQNEGLPATVEYVSGSQTAVLDARYNTNISANLNGLVPDPGGVILVTATRTGASLVSYLNAIVIEEISPSVSVLNPGHLYAEPLDRNRISLSWTDREDSENASGGYQLQRATDSLFSLNVATFNIAANVTSFTNTGLTPNVKYWYRIRALSGATYSEYSNRAKAITPSSIIYVNFNTTIANAFSPWNNTAANSEELFTMSNLKDQLNVPTAVGLSLLSGFNGEFTAGVNTGNNSGIVPDNVLMSDYWLDNSQVSQFKITGLSYTKRYRIGFVGSSSIDGWFRGDYTAKYTINGRSVYLNSWMNSTKIVYIGDVAANSNGEILLTFSTTALAAWGFNAGIVIQEYTDTQGGSMLNSVLDNTGANFDSLSTRTITSANAYPNPFGDLINVDFFNSAAGNRVTAEVYDLNGRLVHRRNFDHLPAGYNTLRIDELRTSQRSGIFIVALKVNGKITQTIKMLRNK